MDKENFCIYNIFEVSEIKLLGRISRFEDSAVLFWSGSGFTVNFTAGEIWAELEADYDSMEPWVSVWIDGVQVSRFIVQKGKMWYCLFRGLTPGSLHNVTLLKETQAMAGDRNHSLLLHNVAVPVVCEKASGGKPFIPAAEKKYKIEFVGDSITTGEGVYGAPSEMDWISGWMGLKSNYFMYVAQNMDAEVRVVSQCGWGIFTGFDNDRNSVIPRHYEKICGLASGEHNEKYGSQKPYDFSSWKADAVVINLGTNDFGGFNNPAKKDSVTGEEWKMHLDKNKKPVAQDVKLITDALYSFLSVVRKNNPSAQIVFAYGMCSFDLGKDLMKCVKKFAKETSDSKIHFVKLNSMSLEKEDEKGSRGHPGPVTHRRAAQKISSLLKGIIYESD